MQFISLQSGSNGNCIYVEAGGVRLLVDAGISGSVARERLARHGRDISAVDAVLISHDHVDHAGNMGVFHCQFDLPRPSLAAQQHSRFGSRDALSHPRNPTAAARSDSIRSDRGAGGVMAGGRCVRFLSRNPCPI